FNIQLEFEDGTNPTPTELEAFERAAFIWEATIINDLPDVSSTNCLSGGGINVDDLHIAVQFEPDDGAGGRLGQAGPCRIRGGTQSPAAGLMLLDSADVADLDASGLLDETILHEMGHVLGIGTLWARFGLLENRSTTSTPTNPCSGEVPGQDTRFVGVEAAAEFAALGGMGNTPAENDTDRYGCGSLDGHFREATFGTELMTPSLGSGAQLSRVTIASLSDLGFYTVSYGTADPYTLPTGGGLFRDPPRRLVCTLGVIEEIP
ncbi:MAG: leishmanolysin-related zinc metalloendopeptidase, partial [Myxococcota bacterium]